MIFEELVKRQIGFPESSRLRYEPLLPSSSELGRLMSAFANTDGGIVILGVLNKHKKITVTGLSDDFRVEAILDKALAKLDPIPLIEKCIVLYEEKKLFAIKVEKAAGAVLYNHDKFKMDSKKIIRVSQENIASETSKVVQNISTEFKLDKILNYLIDYPDRININKHTVQKIILDDGTTLLQAQQLIDKLKETEYVKVYGKIYIGLSVQTEGFLANGGFSGLKRIESRTEQEKKIFISYNWNLKETAEKLYVFLKSKRYSVTMDDHTLKFKSKLSTFMESIRESDYSILLLSEKYLKSENCMTEVLHLLKDRDFDRKVLPIRQETLKIFSAEERLKYIEYWRDQVYQREQLLKSVNPLDAIEELKKLRNARFIHQSIGDFLVEIADMIIYTIEEQEKVSYDHIIRDVEG